MQNRRILTGLSIVALISFYTAAILISYPALAGTGP
jgi:hypothetical protein